MEVAHRPDLFHGHSFGDQLLFHGHDFGGVGLPDDFLHLPLHLLGGISRVQVLDDVLQYSNPVRLVVDHFAHDTLLNIPRLRMRMNPAHDFCHTATHIWLSERAGTQRNWETYATGHLPAVT